jgi:hypothetical protein
MYSTMGVKKPSYNKVLQAYFDAGYYGKDPGTTPSNPGSGSQPQPSTPGQTARIQDGWYYIKNVNAQKYLQVTGNTGKAVQNVEIGKGTGVQGQKWYLKNVSDGYVTLTSALGNFSLDIANGEDTDGANLQIYDSWGGDAQQFAIMSTDTNGVYTIATKASNKTKVVDVYKHATEDGTNVCQWTYNGGANQQWTLEATSDAGKNDASAQQPAKEPEKPAEQPAAGTLPSDISVSYTTVSDWGGSFQGKIVVKNTTKSALKSLTLSFEYGSTIVNMWGGELVSQKGTTVTVKAPSWSPDLAPGQSISFEFIANGSAANAPYNYALR